jgi:hypothetical protein
MDCLLVVEDDPSEAVMRRLIADYRPTLRIAQVLPKRGNQPIRMGIQRFRNACHVLPHIILADLDEKPCAPALLAEWQAQHLPQRILFRVAVREVEAWLLGDRDGIASFLGVPVSRVPQRPEEVADPKQALINIARKGRSRRFVEEFVPPPGSSASQGPFYNYHLAAFVRDSWSVRTAGEHCPSLARAIHALTRFMAT